MFGAGRPSETSPFMRKLHRKIEYACYFNILNDTLGKCRAMLSGEFFARTGPPESLSIDLGEA